MAEGDVAHPGSIDWPTPHNPPSRPAVLWARCDSGDPRAGKVRRNQQRFGLVISRRPIWFLAAPWLAPPRVQSLLAWIYQRHPGVRDTCYHGQVREAAEDQHVPPVSPSALGP